MINNITSTLIWCLTFTFNPALSLSVSHPGPPPPHSTTESSEGVSLQLGNSKDFILSLDIKFTSNGSVSVILETTEKAPPFTIHYVTSTQLIAFKDRDITYGIGSRTSWSTLTRDLLTDLRKGVGLSNTKAVKATKVSQRPTFCLRRTFIILMLMITK